MANEINMQATLTVQRYSPPAQGSGNMNITQTGKHCLFNIQNIGTGAEALNLEDVATLGYLFVKNLDATNYVQLALDSGATQIFAKLRPGEFCLLPANQNGVYAKANTAAVDVCVVMAEL